MSGVEGKEDRSENTDKKKKKLVNLKQQLQTYMTLSLRTTRV